MRWKAALILLPFAAVCLGAGPKAPSPDDQYKRVTADSEEQPGVPKGKLEKFTWSTSKVFPGTTREVTVYVPAQYEAAKPAAVFVCQDGANDIVNQFGSWPEANKAMAKALDEKGYDHKFVFGEGVHSGNHGTQIFPDVMRWMWRDYPK